MLLVQNTQGDLFEVTMSKEHTKHDNMIAFFWLEPRDKDLQGEWVSVDVVKESLRDELISLDYKIIVSP